MVGPVRTPFSKGAVASLRAGRSRPPMWTNALTGHGNIRREGKIVSCDSCGTVVRYGNKIPSGKRLCLDCWKDATKDKKDPNAGPEDANE